MRRRTRRHGRLAAVQRATVLGTIAFHVAGAAAYTCTALDAAGCPPPGSACFVACEEADLRQMLARVNACPPGTGDAPITLRMGPDENTTCGATPVALAMAPTAPATAAGSCGDDNASRYNALCIRSRGIVFDGRGTIFTYAGDHVCASCDGECSLCPGGPCATRQPALFVLRGGGNTLRDFEMRFFPEGLHLREGDGHVIEGVTSRYICEEAITVDGGSGHRLERNLLVGNTDGATGGVTCFQRVEGSACATDADCGSARCYCGLLSHLGSCAVPPPPPLWPAGVPGQCFAPAACGLDKAIQVNGGASTIGGSTRGAGNAIHTIGQPVHVIAGTHTIANNVTCGHRTNANVCQAYDVSGGSVTMHGNRIDRCKFGIRLVDAVQLDAADNVLTNNYVSAFQVKGNGGARLRGAGNRMRNNGYSRASDCQRGALVVRGNATSEIDLGGGGSFGGVVLGGAVSDGGNVFCQVRPTGPKLVHVWNVTDCPCAGQPGCACTFDGPAGASCGPMCSLVGPCCALDPDGACAGSGGAGAAVGIGILGGASNAFVPAPTVWPSPSPTVVDRSPLQTRLENVATQAACHAIVVDECECRDQPDGTPCSDGSLCTPVDVCVGGSCLGMLATTCTPQGPCHDAGTCDPLTGLCSAPLRPDGTSCDDGNACTGGEVCSAGSCGGGAAQPDGDADGTCDAADNCPLDANDDQSDLDADGAGDVCDDDGPLILRRVVLARTPLAGGTIRARATFMSGAAVGLGAGFGVRMSDGRGHDVQAEFTPDDCRSTRSRIVCRAAAGTGWLRIVSRPNGDHRVVLILKNLPIEPPFAPAVAMRFSYGATDLAGTIAAGCHAAPGGLRCGQR